MKPRAELLKLAERCGAVLKGKPDGSEAITVVFTIKAWRDFDAALVSKDKCQYAEDVGMPEYRCVKKCQYSDHPIDKEMP